MSRVSTRSVRGSTLLEVAIALGIMAMCGLGLIGTQLGLARHAQLAATQERAVFVADALAEGARMAGGPGASTAATDKWKALTAAIVPEGRAEMAGAGGDASIATITWAAAQFATASGSAAVSRRGPCIDATVPAGRACVALAFLR